MRLFRIAALSPLILFAQQQQQTPEPAAPKARFHHVALNVTDRRAAIEFLTKRFDCGPAKLGGREDAVWAQKSWILFNQVKNQPPYEIESTIWHIGWGAEDMKATYQKQLDLGTKFQTPLTDISKLANTNGFYYAYVDGPNHALIELNTSQHHHFGHIHFLSDDPIASGQWYAEHFGIRVRKGSDEKRYYEGFQVGPSASFLVDNVNFILFPSGYMEKQWPENWTKHKEKGFAPTTGRVIDHVGLSVDNLDETITRLKSEGVKVIGRPTRFRKTSQRAIMIEGPDHLSIQLVEGHAKKE
jgi:catechol 2,3-dioxygenase-like lactoylglutathione lyase family enzyme